MADTRPTWSYEPGAHLAVLGPDLAAVLPGADPSQVARLWAAVDDGADLVGVLDRLLVDGLVALPELAAVSWDGAAQVTVLVRGAGAHVVVRTADGTVLVDGAAARTWVERSFERVRSVSVLAGGPGAREGDDAAVVDGDGPADVRAIAAGLVRVARVARTATDQPVEPAEPMVDSGAAPVVGSAAVDQPTEAYRVLGTGREPTREPAPGTPRLQVSDGREIVVDAVVVVGRSPEPRDRHAGSPPRLLRLASPQQEISGTHLEVRPGSGPDTGAVVATDLGSTNGTVVEHADGRSDALVPGVGAALGPGAVVHVGDGVTLRLLPSGEAR